MIQPINRNVLITVPKIETTVSGIVISANNDARMERGVVLELDPEVLSFKKGDNVYFKLYSLSSIQLDGEEYHFIKAEDILGIDK